MTAYWCELAWLERDVPEAGVLIETDGGVNQKVTSPANRPKGSHRPAQTGTLLLSASASPYQAPARGAPRQ